MKIASPDALLVEAADRLLAVPQRRGIPLPRLLAPIPFVEPLGLLVTGASLGSVAPTLPPGDSRQTVILLASVFCVMALADAAVAILKARHRLRDGRDWSPSLAARYRSEALSSRERLAIPRFVGLIISTLLCIVAASAFLHAPRGELAMPLVLVIAGLAGPWVGRNASAYADCAMPRDPDLRQPSRAVPTTA